MAIPTVKHANRTETTLADDGCYRWPACVHCMFIRCAWELPTDERPETDDAWAIVGLIEEAAIVYHLHPEQ